MNLYLLTAPDEFYDYDTYDSCVVVAPDPETARTIHPSQCGLYVIKKGRWASALSGEMLNEEYTSWPRPAALDVLLIGKAKPQLKSGEVICSSFNAG